MKNQSLFIYSFLLLLFSSCIHERNDLKHTDIKIIKDTIYLITKDTIYSNIITTVKKDSTNKIKKAVKVINIDTFIQKNIQKTSIVEQDLITYYKNTKHISTKITPWKDGVRLIIFFDLLGNQMYEIEDTKKSYTSITTLRYRDDGSVIDALTHLNPGASMYWYETTTRFEKDNMPLTQESIEYPEKLSSIVNGNRLKKWDNQTKKWNSN